MNEQDKKAFAEAAKGWATKSAGKDLGEYFWQAALEYARGQQEQEHKQIWQAGCNAALEFLRWQQEPVAWMLMDGDVRDSFWLDLSDAYNLKKKPEHKFLPLYTHPAHPVQPAVNEQMLRALKVAQGVLFDAGYDIDNSGEHFSEYVQITDAIAAAEALQDAWVTKNGGKP